MAYEEKRMRVGVLTGGGDVPGMNPAIQAVVRQAASLGWEVVGIRRGWKGLMTYDINNSEASDDTCLMPLSLQTTRAIDRTGSTVLQTARSHLATLEKHLLHILKVIEHLQLDALIPIGGVDTLAFAARLKAEGVRVNTVPKTMDNDVYGTDYCIGFSTAVTRSVEAINALRTPAGSHERVGIVELFGRQSGETALLSGYLSDADRVLIAEVPFDMESLAEKLLADRRDNPSNYAMAVVSEGARMNGDGRDNPLNGAVSDVMSEAFKKLTGVGTISQKLTYLMRTGLPDALDTMVARSLGAMAVQRLEAGEHGLMMAVADGTYVTRPCDICLTAQRRVDVDAFYDANAYRPMIRDIAGLPMFLK